MLSFAEVYSGGVFNCFLVAVMCYSRSHREERCGYYIEVYINVDFVYTLNDVWTVW